MSTDLIAIIGATGNQGSGVVASLLSTTSFRLRAISTNPTSAHAQALLAAHADAVRSGRLTMVQGSMHDGEGLVGALAGAQGLFAAWVSHGDEVAEGKVLVDAAVRAGVQHFVYSSLPSPSELSGGVISKCSFMDAKQPIARYALEKLPAVTQLIPGFFYRSDFSMPLYASREDDGTVVCHAPFLPTIKIQWTDESHDIGVFAAAVFSRGPSSMANKVYPVMGEAVTMGELMKQYAALSGDRAEFRPLPLDEAMASTGAPQTWQEIFGDFHRFMNTTNPDRVCYGTMRPEDDNSHAELGVRASTMAEWLARSRFEVARR